MVRSKITTTLLTLAAVAVWCIIGYKIYRWISPKETPAASVMAPKVENDSQVEDSLILNYRDPFLGNIRETRVADNNYSPAPAPEPVMPVLAYKGLIRDRDGVVKAMITQDGRLDGYAKGAVIDGVRVEEITGEYIIVKWRGAKYIIPAK